MSAREVIAQVVCERWFGGNDACADDRSIASIALDALTSAGYRILSPGQLDDFTKQHCLSIARQCADAWGPSMSAPASAVADEISSLDTGEKA